MTEVLKVLQVPTPGPFELNPGSHEVQKRPAYEPPKPAKSRTHIAISIGPRSENFMKTKIQNDGRGPSRGKRSKRELAANAYHEAGHAVVCRALGGRIKKATIVYNPDENTGGRVSYRDYKFTHRNMTVVTLAGPVAQERFDPASGDGGKGDLEKMKRIWAENQSEQIRRLIRPNHWTHVLARLPACADMSDDELEELAEEFQGDPEPPLDFDECRRRAEKLVADNWPAIEKLAQALLKRWTLTGKEIEALLS